MTSLLLLVDKGKQRIFEFDLVEGVDKVITISGIDLDKAILQTTDDNQTVEVALNTEHRLNDKQEEILAALARIEGKLEK